MDRFMKWVIGGVTCGGLLSHVIRGDWDTLTGIPWEFWDAITWAVVGVVQNLVSTGRTGYVLMDLVVSRFTYDAMARIQIRDELPSKSAVMERALAYYDGISHAKDCGAEVVFRYPTGEEEIVVLTPRPDHVA